MLVHFCFFLFCHTHSSQGCAPPMRVKPHLSRFPVISMLTKSMVNSLFLCDLSAAIKVTWSLPSWTFSSVASRHHSTSVFLLLHQLFLFHFPFHELWDWNALGLNSWIASPLLSCISLLFASSWGGLILPCGFKHHTCAASPLVYISNTEPLPEQMKANYVFSFLPFLAHFSPPLCGFSSPDIQIFHTQG